MSISLSPFTQFSYVSYCTSSSGIPTSDGMNCINETVSTVYQLQINRVRPSTVLHLLVGPQEGQNYNFLNVLHESNDV